MAQRWIIQSRDRILGPWTGAQVREELRAGRVDPFDMVSLEGSNIKRPLVEVDDIFESSRVQMGELVPQQAVANSKLSQEPPKVAVPTALSPQEQMPRPRPSQFVALAAEARVALPPKSKKAGGKSYVITDSTGRLLGPMTSNEVMDMWQRGAIDARSIVQRRDQSRKIPIQKFIDFYERAAPSGIAFLPDNQASGMGFKYATKVSSIKLVDLIVAILTIAAIGFLGQAIYQSRELSQQRQKPTLTPRHRFDLKANEDLVGRIAPLKSKPVAETAAAVSPKTLQGTPLDQAARTAKAAGEQPTISKKDSDKNRKKPTASSRSKTKSRESRTVSKPRRQPPRSVALPTSPRPTTPAMRQAPRTYQPVVSASKPKSAQASGKAWADGSTVTLSSYSFSAAALGACGGKCKIPMSGPQGPVTAVFFKEAHGAAMSGKASGVTLSGIIRKTPAGGWQLIVSSVR